MYYIQTEHREPSLALLAHLTQRDPKSDLHDSNCVLIQISSRTWVETTIFSFDTHHRVLSEVDDGDDCKNLLLTQQGVAV